MKPQLNAYNIFSSCATSLDPKELSKLIKTAESNLETLRAKLLQLSNNPLVKKYLSADLFGKPLPNDTETKQLMDQYFLVFQNITIIELKLKTLKHAAMAPSSTTNSTTNLGPGSS